MSHLDLEILKISLTSSYFSKYFCHNRNIDSLQICQQSLLAYSPLCSAIEYDHDLWGNYEAVTAAAAYWQPRLPARNMHLRLNLQASSRLGGPLQRPAATCRTSQLFTPIFAEYEMEGK